MKKGGYIYIMSNKNNTVLYTGVTSQLKTRIAEHKNGIYKTSFTYKYNIEKLVYFETFSDIYQAIEREKQIKSGSRTNKLELVKNLNPNWDDLFYGL